jgi:hypothetical protein
MRCQAGEQAGPSQSSDGQAVGNAFHEAVVDGLGGGEHAPSPGIALEIIRWSAGDAGERAAAQCPPVQRDA